MTSSILFVSGKRSVVRTVAAATVALLSVFGLALDVSGASRTSANYSVPMDTVDGGGRRVQSAAYLVDGTIGGIGGLGTVVSPPHTVRAGYAGQLYEVTNLVLTATPTNVNELTSRALNAVATFDDGTFATLPGASVTWSVVNGPISGVSLAGVATAGAVYENTPAVVRGSHALRSGMLGLMVINSGTDDFGFYAGDGLDDAWQVQYFGLNNSQARPGSDPDGDGQTNRFEYIVNTNPTNRNSRFNFRIEDVPGIKTNKDLIFSPRFADRTYSLEYRVNANAGAFAPVPFSATRDVGTERTMTDLRATNDFRIYRVRVTFP